MANRIRYTPAQKEEMIAKAKKLRAEGMSLEKVAKELGIHVNSLIRWLKAEPPAKTGKSAPKKKSPAKVAKAKASVGKRVRYTPEQKQAMRDKARAMLRQGKSRLAVQEELGIAYKTLVGLLKGAKPAKKKAKGSAVDPIDRMADIRKRILHINDEIAGLNSEKANLQKEMKSVYKRLGEEIIG